MNIVDAGVVVELLAGGLSPDSLGEEELGAPHLIDSEVLHVLRSLVRRHALTTEQGTRALHGFGAMILDRYPADWLRPRMWELRDNLSGYDATYVALTEQIGATALLTTDARLATAPDLRCRVEVLAPPAVR